MKLLKKIVALTAIAACVVTMSTPVVAKADDVAVCAVSGCHDGKHVMGQRVFRQLMYSRSSHEIEGGICTVTTTYAIFEFICECGAVSGGTSQVYIGEIHSAGCSK